MKTRILKRICSERGQAVPEAAIIIPVMTLIVFAMLMLGYMVYAKIVVVAAATQGARSGARIIGTYGDDASNRQAAEDAAEALAFAGLKPNKISVDVDTDYTGSYPLIGVTVTYDYEMFVPLLADIFNNQTNIPVSYTAVYRIEV